MAAENSVDRNIADLVAVTDAILKGDFDKIASINAEGLLSTLAQKLNVMVVNLKSAEMPLTSAGDQAPNMADSAQNVVALMKQTAGDVLDKADSLSDLADSMSQLLETMADTPNPADLASAQKNMTIMQEAIYDIIASQSYQDVARQKLEKIVKDLHQMRDWLVDALVILNIRKNDSPENIQDKTAKLREINKPTIPDDNKQDLVDDLLSEFGF